MATTENKEAVKEKAPRFFDAAEYTEKLNAALDKLKAEKKPGEVSGKVGKAEILKSGAVKMQALLNEGFTLKQLSDAISEDVFGILPKSLTETLVGKKSKPVKRNRKSNEGVVTSAAIEASPAATQQNKQFGKQQITKVGDLP